MSDVAYWVAFSLIPGIGRVKLERLKYHFGTLSEAWNARPDDFPASGIDERSVQKIIHYRKTIEPDAEIEKLEQNGVCALTVDDDNYPIRLKEIYDPPAIIYVKGQNIENEDLPLAVVGARRATSYGREVTRWLVRDLVENNVLIASGLARGIDTMAHKSALEAGGRTVAVLASGLDIIYPSENRWLAENICQNGALISEYALGTKPRAENFPRRNRIMSGISLGTIVIEAAIKSGALITARMALEQDREVFAVPGSILSQLSAGPNQLIRDGAKAVLSVDDILDELQLNITPRQITLSESFQGNDIEQVLMAHLVEGPIHIDELCRLASMPIATVSSSLTMMELKGMVSQLGNMNYIAARGARTK